MTGVRENFRPPVALLSLFVGFMLTAAAAELTKFKPLRRRLLVLCRHVIAALTFGTLQHNVIARHKSPLYILDLRFQIDTRKQELTQRPH
jgi:hypothetical protein